MVLVDGDTDRGALPKKFPPDAASYTLYVTLPEPLPLIVVELPAQIGFGDALAVGVGGLLHGT